MEDMKSEINRLEEKTKRKQEMLVREREEEEEEERFYNTFSLFRLLQVQNEKEKILSESK